MYSQHQRIELHKETLKYLRGLEKRNSLTSTGNNPSLIMCLQVNILDNSSMISTRFFIEPRVVQLKSNREEEEANHDFFFFIILLL